MISVVVFAAWAELAQWDTLVLIPDAIEDKEGDFIVNSLSDF